jgi:hypothetical protein
MEEITQNIKFMIRRVKDSRLKEYSMTMIVSIHDNKITWRKGLKMFKVVILRPTIWTYLQGAYLQYASPSLQSSRPTLRLHHRCR